jgi:hypothetical protein
MSNIRFRLVLFDDLHPQNSWKLEGIIMRRMIRTGLMALALLAVPLAAQAQATRTWVSGVGDDVNPCSRTAPCKTFAGAISKTAAGGEINVLDPGGFGAVTITKSLTIGTDPAYGGILNSSTNGVVINALATDVITLRGLTINGGIGASTGVNGVRILSAGTVNIENSYIYGNRTAAPNGNGVYVLNTANTVELNIDRTTFSENGLGNDGAAVLVAPTGSGSAKVSISNSAAFNNTRGIRGDSSGTTGTVDIVVNDSRISNNTLSGLSVVSGASSAATLTLTRSISTSNTSGVNSNGAVAVVRISGSVVTGNASGLLPAASGQIISYGNNVLDGNAASNTPTSTIALR